MNLALGLILIAGIDIVLVVAGYVAAGWFRSAPPAMRLLGAPLFGLGLLLWNVSVVNLALPLRGPAVWLCLWPLPVVILTPRLRRLLVRDLSAAWRRAEVRAVLLGGAVLTALLLWPLAQNPRLAFFSGTGNHDNFFWVTGAAWLRNHTYLQAPAVDALYPVFANVSALIGLHPLWGRMGAEGLGALTAGLLHTDPLRLYVFAVAALALPWLAALLLLARETGLRPRTPLLLGFATALQPLFIFFVANGNLPNLLGAIFAGALITAASQLRTPASRGFGAALFVLSLHALLCAYPEIVPCALFSAGLIALAAFRRPASGESRRWQLGFFVAAGLGALALNPATTLRAAQGLAVSFQMARGGQHWADRFATLAAADYLPAFFTLARSACRDLGWAGGLAATVLLLGSGALAFRAARHRWLLLFSLAGFAALLAYTLATGFSYGWQKSVQFAAVPLAVLAPGGMFEGWRRLGPQRRRLAAAALAAIALFFAYAESGLLAESYRRAQDKGVTERMLTLRDTVAARFPGRPVFVQSRTFSMSFFHGMWAAYLFAKNPVYFSARDPQAGGYLRQVVRRDDPAHPAAGAAGAYVGRDWADTFDADCPRLISDSVFALLSRWNRAGQFDGVYPRDGVPDYAAAQFALELNPWRDAQLDLVLATRYRDRLPPQSVEVTVTAAAGRPAWRATLPWRDGDSLTLSVPLAAGADNRVTVRILPDDDAPADADHPFPFAFRSIRVTGRAAP